MAFRNIFRQRRRSLLTGLTMIGGLVLLSLSIALSEGTYSRIIDTFTRLYTGHVQIHKQGYLDKPSLYNTIDDYKDLCQKLGTEPNVLSWTPRLQSVALAFIGPKTAGARIIGIEPEMEQRTTTLAYKVKEGSFLNSEPDNTVMIGSNLAKVIGARVGDEMVLVGQAADGSIANDIFTVCGIIGKGGNSYERMNCYMHLRSAQNFLVLDGRIHEIALVARSYKQSLLVTDNLRRILADPELDIQPWQEVEKQFFKSMQADVQGMWITLLIIMIIVGIGVLNTVLMTILERTREFGVLKALGTRPAQVFKLIVLETAFLSIIAALAGLLISLPVNLYFSRFGLDYPAPIDIGGIEIATLQASITVRSLCLPVAITIFTALLVSILPAVRAARVVPMKAMRAH